MKRMTTTVIAGALALAGTACGELSPTSVDDDLLPIEPTSIEVRLSWEEFGSNLEVFGGYGSPRELGSGVAARAFGGVLDARTLVRWGNVPSVATVTDTTGTSRTDSDLTLRGGRIVVFIDTLRSVADGPVTLELGALSQHWDPTTTTWTLAADTAGRGTPWQEPGAGPVRQVATGVWDPAAGDSAVFVLDSAQVEIWNDTTAADQGALVGVLTEGARLKLDNVALRASVAPSVRPDTVVDVSAALAALSFIYTPEPGSPEGSIRVGGAPAWRTVLDIDVPLQLNGPATLCAAAGCPVELRPTRVNYAALVLSTKRTDPAFAPSDTLGVDVRVVYDRAAMPKSPLGQSLLGTLGARVSPSFFDAGEGSEVEIPITNFVRDILEGDSIGGFPPPRSLALLSIFEPSSIAYGSFFGPGTTRSPVLKLIVTAGRAVELP